MRCFSIFYWPHLFYLFFKKIIEEINLIKYCDYMLLYSQNKMRRHLSLTKKATLYQEGEYEKRRKLFKKRISEGEDLFYELGNFYYRQKKIQ